MNWRAVSLFQISVIAATYLVAPITDSGMTDVSTRIAERLGYATKRGLAGGSLEGVTWMMAVLVKLVAFDAKIVIFASSARDKLSLREHCAC